jgi:hypothetical protein
MRREDAGDPADDAIPPGLRLGTAIGAVFALAWVLSEVVVPFLIGVALAA